jgi:NitT/TauT family transport system substrate-binding protein
MPIRFSDRRMLVALATCFSVACGSGAASRQSQQTQVHLAVTRGGLVYLPVLVAGPAGCFKKHGLTVTIEETEGASKSIEALLGGSVDVAACGYLQTLDLVAQGRPLRAVLVMQRLLGFAAIVSPRASRPIRTIADLKGMKVGVATPGNDFHRILNQVLRRHGMQPEDVRIVALGPPVNQIASVEHGLVDVMLSPPTTISVLQRRHPNLVTLIDTRTPGLTKEALGVEELPASVLTVNEGWLRSNSDTARRLTGALQDALVWIQDHTPEEIREALPASCRSPDAAADLDAILSEKSMLSKDGRMTPELHDAAVKVSGIVDRARLEEAYTNEFLGR